MTDQDYTKLLNDATTTDNLTSALEMLTNLYVECNHRSFEAMSGKRSRRSVQSRKFIATVNAVQANFNVKVSYTRKNRYEVKK